MKENRQSNQKKQSNERAQFIAIEGLEGAGKSTAIEFIRDILSQKKIESVFTREPGGTFLAEKIRKLLITPYVEEALCPEAELLLMYATRMQHVERLIKPALNSGKWVVSDRFNWSSLAYQGGGRELGFDKVKQLNDLLLSSFRPDLTIYLDIEPELGLQRAKSRNALDRIEQEKIEFFNRAREIFLKLVKENPQTSVVINANNTIEQVQAQLTRVFSKFIK
ncbi:dTMP kinase [Cysteiniphilum sp. QT6929]|uniref:dTMP kinase n=1 Tax=Cysteiniphilum sp. QT6929 TaxID=2975055 RepID=UPI0024B33387|nr:dTMP kinase [Cysteiniphilum sp. QT6929]WHN66227.1 dTMP kinase [Cysteiniphilum sp. QT6929]